MIHRSIRAAVLLVLLAASNVLMAAEIIEALPARAEEPWSAADAEALLRKVPPLEPIYALAYSPDGRLVASAQVRAVHLWDAASGRELRRLSGHDGKVSSVVFSPDGNTLASGSRADGTVRLWDTRSGRELFKFDNAYKVRMGGTAPIAFSPDGSQLVLAGAKADLLLWRVSDGTLLQTLQSTEVNYRTVAFSPDGRLLVAGGWNSRLVYVWRVNDGTLTKLLDDKRQGQVTSLSFSADGKQLAVGGWLGDIVLWNTEDWQVRRALPARTEPNRSLSVRLVFSPDAKTLAYSGQDMTVRLWDTHTGQEGSRLPSYGGYLLGLAFSPDGKRLVTGGFDGIIRFWDTQSGALLQRAGGHRHTVNEIAPSPDGRYLAAAGVWSVDLWDLAEMRLSRQLEIPAQVRQLSLGAGGRWLAVTASGSTSAVEENVFLWDLTGKRLERLWQATAPTLQLRPKMSKPVLSPDGRWLALSIDTLLHRWNLAGNPVEHDLLELGGTLDAVALTPDFEQRVAAEGNALVFHYLADSAEALRLKTDAKIKQFALGADGRFAVTVSDKKIVRWEVEAQDDVQDFSPPEGLTHLTFSPDTNVLAAILKDSSTLFLHDLASGQESRSPLWFSEKISAMSFVPGGDLLAISDASGALWLWDRQTRQWRWLLVAGQAGAWLACQNGDSCRRGGDHNWLAFE